MQTVFISISVVLAIISPILYARAILKGDARPHRTSRFVILAITLLATISLFAEKDTVTIWIACIGTLQALLVFALSIKYGMGGWTKIDISCLCIAFVGILLWKLTKDPALALYFSILADFTGMVPTYIKTYRLPHTEVWYYYVLGMTVDILILLSVHHWVPKEFAYPLYLFFINISMLFLVWRKYIMSTKTVGVDS